MAGFSKLIWADLLKSAQDQAIIKSGTNDLEGNKQVSDYTAGAQKAVLFTDDGYIVTHGHQYYTGIPTSDSKVGVVKPYAISTTDVNTGANAGDAIVTTSWTGEGSTDANGNSLFKVYGVLTDKLGRPFVVVDDANSQLSHTLTLGNGTNSVTFDPKKDTTFTFSKLAHSATETEETSVHNKFRVTTNIDSRTEGAETAVYKYFDVEIDPAIHNNLVLANELTAAAKHILINSVAIDANGKVGGKDCSIELVDSGLSFSLATAVTGKTEAAFVKDADGNYNDTYIPTEKAIASYVSGAIGEITGAMRYQGVADGNDAASDWNTASWTSQEQSKVEGGVTVEVPEKGTSAVCKADYQTGDVYYVTDAGYYAGQYCEVGDMLIAKSDKGDAYSDAHWTVVQANWTAENKGAELKYNESVVIATIGGIDITAKLPSAVDNTATYTLLATKKAATVTGSDTAGYAFAAVAGSTNGDTNIALGANQKSIDASGKVTYSHAETYLNIKGSEAITDFTPITVTNDADGNITITHNTSITENSTVNDTSLVTLDFDAAGHVIKTHAISNKIELGADNSTAAQAAYGTEGEEGYVAAKDATNILKNYDTENFGGNSDFNVKFVGKKSAVCVDAANNVGAAAEDVTITTAVNPATGEITFTPSIIQRFRALEINGTSILTTNNYAALNLVAGNNITLTTDADDPGKVTIAARDTWRSVKYYAANASTVSDVTGAANADDTYNDGTEATDAAKLNFVTKTLGTNPLVFGNEFMIAKGEVGAADTDNLDPEIHIEWCEIRGTNVTYTF